MDNLKVTRIKKKVSVVMCTFNGEKYLKEQMNSILSQSYPLFEIIVRDDCSTDNTWYILLEYQTQYPNLFKCFKNEQNLGYGSNFRIAMLQARGDCIAFSDQDDIWMPNKIKAQIDIIDDKLLVVSNSRVLENSTEKNITLFDNNHPQNINIEKLIWENTIFGHTCMISSLLLKYIKEVRIVTAHDGMIALICYSQNSVAFTDQELQLWRRHSETITGHSILPSADKNKIKGYYKVFYTLYCLIFGCKSTIIQNGFNNINHILYQLVDEVRVSKNIVDLVLLTKLMSRQTLFSYIRASFICWRLRINMFENLDGGLKKNILIFTFVYRWWFDHQDSMSY